MSTATASFLVHNRPPLATLHFNSKPPRRRRVVAFSPRTWPFERIVLRTGLVCGGARRNSPTTASAQPLPEGDGDGNLRRVLQFSLWVAEGIYILWLFLLPYAPSKFSIHHIVCNFYMMPAFLIPYMAIRLDSADAQNTPTKSSQLASVMTNGAPVVGLIGGAICLISTLWALFGRPDDNFGGIADRWDFLVSYIGSERLAYAFIWDICLYTIFQPWLIGDNIQNVQKSKVNIANYLRFVPVVGLVVYLVCLNLDEEV
ncbi:hypothetical protein CsSME_00022352 [Camellia sinensis var. sinensis]